MKFDVILPTYNGERFIEESVNSVLNQTYFNFHITIIDDVSSDDTREVLQKIKKKNPEKISLILLKNNLRAAGARMEAIKRTNGDIISFLDQDDVWSSNKLELQLQKFKEGADVVHSDIDFINIKGEVMHGKAEKENLKREKIFSGDNEKTKQYFCKGNYIRLTTSAITRKSFHDVDGFDTELFGGEDWYFWLKIAMSNKDIKHIPEKLTLKRVHENNTSEKYKIKRGKGLLSACKKAEDNYPELQACLKDRKIHLHKRTITSFVGSKEFKKAKKYFWDAQERVKKETFSFMDKISMFLLAHSGHVGYFLLKIRKNYHEIIR